MANIVKSPQKSKPADSAAVPRTLAVLLGSDTIVRLVDGLQCPRCKAGIHNDAELTDDGWRLLCRGCHVDIITVEGGEVS